MSIQTLFQQTTFMKSTTKLDQFPPDQGQELAFVGRSNAGKSTVMNVLCQQRQLAKSSKTPGRTQLINFFSVTEQLRLVDLPGFGYAKVPQAVQKTWHLMMQEYFENRESLKGLVHIMDVRHPMQPLDEVMLDWAYNKGCSVHVILNKADKLSFSQAKQQYFLVAKAINNCWPGSSLQLFSGLKRQGIDEAFDQLQIWLGPFLDEMKMLEARAKDQLE
jgi:GTP-binding protein